MFFVKWNACKLWPRIFENCYMEVVLPIHALLKIINK